MLSGYRTFDSDGNDVTPMCREADGLDLDDGCGQCVLRDECPGYYDGCFEAVNHKTIEDKHIERLYKVLHDLERGGSDDAPALRWAIFTLEQEVLRR